MFFEDTTVRAPDDSLCIGNHSMNPRQKPTCSFRVSKDNFVMIHGVPIYGFSIRPPTIGANGLQKTLTFFSLRSIAKSLQETLNGAGRSIVNPFHVCKSRPALRRCGLDKEIQHTKLYFFVHFLCLSYDLLVRKTNHPFQ